MIRCIGPKKEETDIIDVGQQTPSDIEDAGDLDSALFNKIVVLTTRERACKSCKTPNSLFVRHGGASPNGSLRRRQYVQKDSKRQESPRND